MWLLSGNLIWSTHLWAFFKFVHFYFPYVSVTDMVVVRTCVATATRDIWPLMFLKLQGALFITYLLTYLLTLWCRVLLEKLNGLQLVKKFPAFHGTRRFITALTRVRHLSLFWASPVQSIFSHPTSWRFILILSTHLRLDLASGLFPSGFPTVTCVIVAECECIYNVQEQ